jgi:hypothetical protein
VSDQLLVILVGASIDASARIATIGGNYHHLVDNARPRPTDVQARMGTTDTPNAQIAGEH